MNIKSQLQYYKNALNLCSIIKDTRFVGGSVRDAILNKKNQDLDLATSCTPDQIKKILSENKINYHEIGIRFGTITAIYNEELIEITTLRTDAECDGRHALVEFTQSWEKDASRRDFTINALSADTDGNIYDYFNGMNDLNNQIVRFIGSPEERIIEDYLRILRFFRFTSYYGKNADAEGLHYVIKYASKVELLSRERIKSELTKLLLSSNKFATLILMEPILACIFKKYKNFVKDILLLEQIEKAFEYSIKPELFFALWDQDNSLPLTKRQFQECEKLRLIKITDWSYNSLKQLLKNHKETANEIIFYNIVINNVDIKDKLLLDDLNKLLSLKIKTLPISGEDLLSLGMKAGKNIGKLLSIAEHIWYEREFKITKEQLIDKIKHD